MKIEISNHNVHLIAQTFEVLGSEEHGKNLLHAWQNFEKKSAEMRSNYMPSSGIPLSDCPIKEVFELTRVRFSEYQNAFLDLLSAWDYHLGLIAIKTQEENNA